MAAAATLIRALARREALPPTIPSALAVDLFGALFRVTSTFLLRCWACGSTAATVGTPPWEMHEGTPPGPRLRQCGGNRSGRVFYDAYHAVLWAESHCRPCRGWTTRARVASPAAVAVERGDSGDWAGGEGSS